MEENIHAEHRKRLTELIYKSGIENVSEVQALEFILFFGIPRGDTNPLAHRLLKKFKNIANINVYIIIFIKDFNFFLLNINLYTCLFSKRNKNIDIIIFKIDIKTPPFLYKKII